MLDEPRVSKPSIPGSNPVVENLLLLLMHTKSNLMCVQLAAVSWGSQLAQNNLGAYGDCMPFPAIYSENARVSGFHPYHIYQAANGLQSALVEMKLS